MTQGTVRIGALILIVFATAMTWSCRPSSGANIAAKVTAEPDAPTAQYVSVEPAEPSSTESGGFAFVSDGGGKLLERALTPGSQPYPSDPKRTEPQSRRIPAAVERPELPLPPLPLDLPKMPPSQRALLKPRPAPENSPFEDYRETVLATPQRLELPSPVLLRIAAADVHAPTTLPTLSRLVIERASLDDPTTWFSGAQALAQPMPQRGVAAPFVRISLPDVVDPRRPSTIEPGELMSPVVRPLR